MVLLGGLCITSESSSLPSVARLANGKAVCSRLIRGVIREAMKDVDIRHPYFTRVQCGASECFVELSEEFPIHGFRLAVVEPRSDLIEIASDIGFRHEDGFVDWVRGAGTTVEEAAADALQYFLNLVVHPAGLAKDDFAERSEIV